MTLWIWKGKEGGGFATYSSAFKFLFRISWESDSFFPLNHKQIKNGQSSQRHILDACTKIRAYAFGTNAHTIRLALSGALSYTTCPYKYLQCCLLLWPSLHSSGHKEGSCSFWWWEPCNGASWARPSRGVRVLEWCPRLQSGTREWNWESLTLGAKLVQRRVNPAGEEDVEVPDTGSPTGTMGGQEEIALVVKGGCRVHLLHRASCFRACF